MFIHSSFIRLSFVPDTKWELMWTRDAIQREYENQSGSGSGDYFLHVLVRLRLSSHVTAVLCDLCQRLVH